MDCSCEGEQSNVLTIVNRTVCAAIGSVMQWVVDVLKSHAMNFVSNLHVSMKSCGFFYY